VIIGLSITGALLGYVISLLMASLLGISLFIIKIYRPLNHSSPSNEKLPDNLKTLIRYGLPLYISILVGGFALQYQNILLSIFTTNHEIGNYKAAMNFTVLVRSLAIPITTTLLPAFSKLETNRENTREFFRMATKYTSIAILPIAALLIIYSREMIQIMYGTGHEWELASTFLSIYALQFLFVGLGQFVLGSLFNGLGETKTTLRITLVNVIIIIALAPILTWALRINGMIVTIILASITSTLYALHTAKSKLQVELNMETTTKIYAATLISALPILALQKILLASTLIQVTIGAAIYLTTYLILIPTTKIITQPELEQIRTIIEKIKPLKYLAHPIFYFGEKILSRMP